MVSIGAKLDNKYLVVGRLGSGGFGEVFLAEDEAIPGRQLALKVLTRDSAGNHDDLIWEMRTLAKLDHPGIVRFVHHFTQDDRVVLVMEYCAGGSLWQRLNAAGPIAHDEVFRWGRVLCDTLSLVHGNGIVHHDIKPANILFTQDGAIKLGDFGVANRHAGTRPYMPPEMLLGGFAARTDPRVDVYSLGLTLLEMLTGSQPFASMSDGEALAARAAHDFVPDTLPRWVQDILLRATHPTPELRFQYMVDFGEAIQSKHVPYVFDGNRIKAHRLVERAEARLARRKWKSAQRLAEQALRLSPDCAPALVAAGRCQLMIRRIDRAREYFSRALRVNPRTHVQKELGWLNLEAGNLPLAISLLCDHLDRNAADLEAYNLLLKCFVLSERYEAGDALARDVMKENPGNDCFRSNRFLCGVLDNSDAALEHDVLDFRVKENPFFQHNLMVAMNSPACWSAKGKPALRDKLLFQEYHFGVALEAEKRNELSLRTPDGMRTVTSTPLVSIGAQDVNDFELGDRGVSRRHAVIVNLPGDVWLYDLGSTWGTRLDKETVHGRAFLDGVHRIDIGPVSLEVGACADRLV